MHVAVHTDHLQAAQAPPQHVPPCNPPPPLQCSLIQPHWSPPILPRPHQSFLSYQLAALTSLSFPYPEEDEVQISWSGNKLFIIRPYYLPVAHPSCIVSYCCCNQVPQTWWNKTVKCITLQMQRSAVHRESYGAKFKLFTWLVTPGGFKGESTPCLLFSWMLFTVLSS